MDSEEIRDFEQGNVGVCAFVNISGVSLRD
jgi:hypothetical protein